MLYCYYFTPDGNLKVANEPDVVRRAFQDGTLYWVDLKNPTESEEEILWEIFNFHQLAVEDCIATHQYPKIDDYGDYLYLIVHAVDYNKKDGAFRTTELDVFLTPQFVVTFHYDLMRSTTQQLHRLTEGAITPHPLKTTLINAQQAAAYYDSATSSWIAEAGMYTIKIGASALKIKQTATVQLAKDLMVEKVNKVLTPQVKIDELKLRQSKN